MFDWSKDNLASLHEIAHEAGQCPELRHFAAYCQQEAGHHETEAFASLRLFMTEAERWPEQDKRDFVDWLLRLQHNHPTLHNIIHNTLYHELVDPVLRQWLKETPDDPKRLRWSDRIGDLERAREAAPDDPVIQRRLVDLLIRRIKADCGHLPGEYPGHPDDDADMLDEAITLLKSLTAPSGHDKRLLAEAVDLREQIAALQGDGNVTVIDVDIPEEDL